MLASPDYLPEDVLSLPFPNSALTFALTAASILMSGGQGRLKPSPANFFVASMPGVG